MNKGKSIGICCLITAAAILVVSLIYWQRAEDGDSYGLQPDNLKEATSSAVSGQEINVLPTMKITEEKEQPAESEEPEQPEQGEYSKAEMDIKNLNEEVLSLMDVTRERLEKEIRIFANGYGFASMTETHYYGETVIDHEKDTVSAVFYFEVPGTKTFKFNVIVQREKKTFRFEPW